MKTFASIFIVETTDDDLHVIEQAPRETSIPPLGAPWPVECDCGTNEDNDSDTKE